MHIGELTKNDCTLLMDSAITLSKSWGGRGLPPVCQSRGELSELLPSTAYQDIGHYSYV